MLFWCAWNWVMWIGLLVPSTVTISIERLPTLYNKIHSIKARGLHVTDIFHQSVQVKTIRSGDANMRHWTGWYDCYRLWCAYHCSESSRCQNHCRLVVHWNPSIKFNWNLNPNTNICIEWNIFEKDLCKMLANLLRPQRVNFKTLYTLHTA